MIPVQQRHTIVLVLAQMSFGPVSLPERALELERVVLKCCCPTSQLGHVPRQSFDRLVQKVRMIPAY